MKISRLKWLIGFAGWCICSVVMALSLADVELHSSLNQPLDARIQLPGVSEGELGSLHIDLRSTNTASLSAIALRHEVIQDSSGAYIQISSKEAIKEPVLSFTLEASWSDGRMGREYMLLMDPK